MQTNKLITMKTKHALCGLLSGLLLLAAGTAQTHAALILARAGSDFRSVSPSTGNTTASFGGGLGIPDTAGLGHWNYYGSSAVNPTLGTLSLLDWGTTGNAGNAGFKGPLFFNQPAISAAKIFGDGVTPSASEIAWHPGDGIAAVNNQIYAVLRWTADASEAGPIDISGIITKVGSTGFANGADFHVFVAGVELFTQASLLPSSGNVPFGIVTSISAGQNVDFVLGNGNGDWSGDETRLSATISAVPEPGTALLLGIGCLGATALRRRRSAAVAATLTT